MILSDQSEDSLWNRRIPPTFRNGKMATAITIKPIPPNHCSSERHSKMPLLTSARFVITVEPVVVTPDMVSKNASVKLISWTTINGSAPKALTISQHRVVNRKICRGSSRNNFARVSADITAPAIKVTAAQIRNPGPPLPCANRSYMPGMTVTAPCSIRKTPMT